LNPQDELLAIIDAYLDNGMSEEERFAFEEKIAQDETLAAKVTEVRLTNEAIYYGSLAELKNTIGKDIKNIKYKETFNWKKASYISIASLVLLSGVTTYLFTTDNKDESEKSNTTKPIEENQHSSKQDNSSVTEENTDNKKKVHQEYSLETEGKTNATKTDITSAPESITPTEYSLKSVEETKPADSGNKTQTHNSDVTDKTIPTPEVAPKINCDKSFKINTEASCKQKETGSIIITSDGAYSYTYHLDIRSTSGSKGTFTNIPAGSYEILVTYGKECTYKKQVSIAEKWCAMNESYSFNPDYNEKWIFNYETGASGTFTIFDKSGKDIYGNTFGTGNEEWNGNDRQGIPVPVGIYFAIINYSDGRKEKVELTIVR